MPVSALQVFLCILGLKIRFEAILVKMLKDTFLFQPKLGKFL